MPRRRILTLREVESRHIERVLRQLQGNRVWTAHALGISRRSLQYRLKEYALDHIPSQSEPGKER